MMQGFIISKSLIFKGVNMYRLIVWYQDGTKEEATYTTEEEARKAEKGFYMAFGRQIASTLITRG